MAAAGLHLLINCHQCSVQFRQSRSDHLFCSNKCAARNWRVKTVKLWRSENRTCQVCSKIFTPITFGQIHCSKTCTYKKRLKTLSNGKGKFWSKGLQFAPRRQCVLCNTLFYAPPVLIRRGGGKFCSNKCRVKNMAYHPEMYPQSQSRRGLGGKRDDLGNIYFRSAWEANYARYLNFLKSVGEIADWKYECKTFEFSKIKRGSRFYTPDFLVTFPRGNQEFHEVKGYMDAKSQTKLKRMAKYFPGVRVVLIDKYRYHGIAKTVKGLIKNWEGRTRID